ncbi:MAG: fasciclin domain-containing protein [Acidobacteriia bacterium]|nr:fasciclin domain-containing protein [Terriglobia bacterium]
MKRLFMAAMAILLASISALASHTQRDVVDTAIHSGSFNTLTQALKAADMVDTLKGPGPYTVFAPTDQAFRQLPPGTLEVLMKPENKEQLRSILTYHVVPETITTSQARRLNSVDTLDGQELRISFLKGVVGVNEAKVTKSEIAASNGVIHAVDRVLLPPGTTSQVSKIGDMLARFESKAIEARREAETLESGRRHSWNWQSHARHLGTMTDQVNEMGKILAQLEASKSQATLFQEKAVEAARPHLEDMARRVERAINWLNEDRRSTSRAEYKDNLHGLWVSADRLYTDVDTITDYHEARMRLNDLTQEPIAR